jgi:hypothetical protein
MSRKTICLAFSATACVLALGIAGYWFVSQESQEEQKFKRIVDGMTVEEVEAILGTGEIISQSNVPSYRVAVNAQEVEAYHERHRKAGTVPTGREFETRDKYLVEGEVIYQWRSGCFEIWVAFKDDKVCEKHLKDWNYL